MLCNYLSHLICVFYLPIPTVQTQEEELSIAAASNKQAALEELEQRLRLEFSQEVGAAEQ